MIRLLSVRVTTMGSQKELMVQIHANIRKPITIPYVDDAGSRRGH